MKTLVLSVLFAVCLVGCASFGQQRRCDPARPQVCSSDYSWVSAAHP